MAASNCTRGLMSPVCPRIMVGRSSIHIASPMPSNLHYPLRSCHMAAIRRLLLLPTLVPAPMPSSGRNHRNNNLVCLVAFKVGRLPRSCSNCSKSKPSIKACKIERWSSARRDFLPRQVVTYTGTHRFLHSDSTLMEYKEKGKQTTTFGDQFGLLGVGGALSVQWETTSYLGNEVLV